MTFRTESKALRWSQLPGGAWYVTAWEQLHHLDKLDTSGKPVVSPQPDHTSIRRVVITPMAPEKFPPGIFDGTKFLEAARKEARGSRWIEATTGRYSRERSRTVLGCRSSRIRGCRRGAAEFEVPQCMHDSQSRHFARESTQLLWTPVLATFCLDFLILLVTDM